MSPQTWSNWIAGVGTVAVPMGWRIANNLIHLEPPPAQAEIVVIEYLSSYPVVRDATDADLAPVDGFLTPILPLVPREGYIGDGALPLIEREGASTWGTAAWGTAVWGKPPLEYLRRVPVVSTKYPAYQVRAEAFEADTDTSALGDDHVLSLGMTWRLRKGLEMDYAEEFAEYERDKDVFIANDASRARSFIIGGDGPRNEVEPMGNGNWMVS